MKESVVATETSNTGSADSAVGPSDAQVARIKPGGSLAVALPPGFVLRDDGTSTPDIRVIGTSGGSVSYTIFARTPSGAFERIDRVRDFGEHDMNHHKIAVADAFKITNTGKDDLLVDSIEALRPLTAK